MLVDMRRSTLSLHVASHVADCCSHLSTCWLQAATGSDASASEAVAMVPWGVRDVALQVLIRLRPFSSPSSLLSCVQSQFTVMPVLCMYAAVHDDSLLCRPRVPNLTWV